MKLSDYRDSNGIALQTYVDSLIEKLAAHTNLTGFVVIADLEKAKLGQNDGIHLVSCLGEGANFLQVPAILKLLARQMETQPTGFEKHTKLHEEEN